MKNLKVFLISLLIIAMVLGTTACANPQADPSGESNTPDNSSNAGDPSESTGETEPDATDPKDGEEEQVDPYSALYPDKEGQVPGRKEIVRLAEALAAGGTGTRRIMEIAYTWKNGKTSMEITAGNIDDYYTHNDRPLETQEVFQLVYDENEFYNYALYLPEGYDPADTQTKWPVIYFFHGIGESGTDLSKVLNYGLPEYLLDGNKLEAIVICPQCPADSHWADTNRETERLAQFIPQMAEKYNIDTDRTYLTGLSMGGRCSWKLALEMPDTFAAMVVCCGRTNTYDFSGVLDMPIWMFHGAGDPTTPFNNINLILPELAAQNHEYYKLTVLPTGGHEIWSSVYARPEIYDWLLTFSLADRNITE